MHLLTLHLQPARKSKKKIRLVFLCSQDYHQNMFESDEMWRENHVLERYPPEAAVLSRGQRSRGSKDLMYTTGISQALNEPFPSWSLQSSRRKDVSSNQSHCQL